MTPWTDDRVARLKALWNNGTSATEIAAELGGVTRNAVLGKIHRDGLSGRTKRVAAPRRAPKERLVRVSRPSVLSEAAPTIEPSVASVDDAEIPIEQRRTLVSLDSRCCHWPVGHPCEAGFFFCGAVVNEFEPYCPSHMRRAHALPGDRRRMPDPAKSLSRPKVNSDAWR